MGPAGATDPRLLFSQKGCWEHTVLACEAHSSWKQAGPGAGGCSRTASVREVSAIQGRHLRGPAAPTSRLCSLTGLCTCQALGEPRMRRGSSSSWSLLPQVPWQGPLHWGLCSSTEAGDVGDFLDPPPPPPALSARSSIRGCFLGTQILFYKLPPNGCYHRTIASQLLLCGLPPASGPRRPQEVAFLDHFLHSESSSPLSRSPPSW